MKRILLIPFLFLFLLGCSDEPTPVINTPSEELYIREDASTTLVPLVNYNKWNYRINTGTEEKPYNQIRGILDNDTITSIRFLPVRQYDNNEGWGKYLYQTLCYITAKGKVFFYMNDNIYVGRYLQSDNNGFESVIWDYELPTHCTEQSSRYFVLNRDITSPNMDEDYLHELAGYHTIDVEVAFPDYKKYTECKLFEYKSKRNNIADPVRINRFYFKEGKGLIRYQQFVLSPDNTELKLYEQDLVEGF
jgi:hypothetical protein